MHSGFTQFSLTESDFNQTLLLQFGDIDYQVKSNSAQLLAGLQTYFSGYLAEERSPTTPPVTVYFYQTDKQNTGFNWLDWPREAGKTGLKEQIYDVEDGRWIHKFKTGMVFFQHLTMPFAIGPCESHQSQIINFIINQHINRLQQSGGLIGHAACLQVAGIGIAIAAYSGGGKSTTMLKLMDEPHAKFVSNDRLFLYNSEDGIVAKGVAKQPRVNPGTLLNNTKLIDVLPKARQQALSEMATSALWALEEKYDVMVAQYYGPQALLPETKLHHLVLLNWQPGVEAPVELNQIDPIEKQALMAAIAKSPGPFYQDKNGHFLTSASIPALPLYSECLTRTHVWEVTGGADFESLLSLIKQHLLVQN